MLRLLNEPIVSMGILKQSLNAQNATTIAGWKWGLLLELQIQVIIAFWGEGRCNIKQLLSDWS